MLKGWNQKVNIKIDGRNIGVKFYDAHAFAKHLGIWRIMTGSIHMNLVEHHGNRPSEKMVGRFETRIYEDGRLGIEVKPTRTDLDIASTHTIVEIPRGEIRIDWVREQVAKLWHDEPRLWKEREST